MREILFRGKNSNGNWIYGNLNFYPDINRTFIRKNNKELLPSFQSSLEEEVNKKTVGQCVGLTDKNGTKIFEGDIVKAQDDIFGSPFCNGITGKVVYEETAFFIEPQNPVESQWLFNECAVYEVIGNIHDNPELLESESDTE